MRYYLDKLDKCAAKRDTRQGDAIPKIKFTWPYVNSFLNTVTQFLIILSFLVSFSRSSFTFVKSKKQGKIQGKNE